MKKNILLFYCFLAMMAASLKAQEIRPMPADSAYGVVHISVCNLREEGKFTSGMSTQALLGMPVKVLQYNGWYEIQTPDDYTGWVHRMVITPMSKERYDEWNRAEKIVVTSHYGFAYEFPTRIRCCCGQSFEVGGEQRTFLSSVLSRRTESISFEIHFPTGSGMASFTETRC